MGNCKLMLVNIMPDILTLSGFVILCLALFMFVVYVKSFNHFLRIFKQKHESKWNELGALPRLSPGFRNKRARAQVDRWIKNETDEKYCELKEVYSRVSRNENIAGILIIVSILFYILDLVLTAKI